MRATLLIKFVWKIEICEDFKTIHQACSDELAKEALETFCEKWTKSYKKIMQGLLENP
ncbi:transposase [Fictibacillus macauensis ZFHKF-1]|uniref:Transposase n=1 Tax=Fictibacillus macauensis ZFHKF-1 TaxID=1196324 RepID=I8AM83_9BACL|nr:transposase [Fictibacillus macauensis ZFHKF-1]